MDLADEILQLVAPAKLLITLCYRGPDVHFRHGLTDSRRPVNCHAVDEECDGLVESFRKLSRVEALLYRVISTIGIAAMEFSKAIRGDSRCSDQVVAYAADRSQVWSRLTSPYLGARFVFADRGLNGPASPQSLVGNFGIPELPDIGRLYGICGNRVAQSLSPAVHNAAFRRLGCDALYLPFPDSSIDDVLALFERLARVGFEVKGLTVTAPFKEETSRRFCAKRKIVNQAQSANALRLEHNREWSDTTDDLGLKSILSDHSICVQNTAVVITGCGGSGRVAAQALIDLKARVILYNRSSWRASLASELLNIPCYPLGSFNPEQADLIVNTIPFPVSEESELPFSLDRLKAGCVLIDYSYSRVPNRLVTTARRQGLIVIDGLVMLEKQLTAQFELLTDMNMPADIVSGTLQQYGDYQRCALQTMKTSLNG